MKVKINTCWEAGGPGTCVHAHCVAAYRFASAGRGKCLCSRACKRVCISKHLLDDGGLSKLVETSELTYLKQKKNTTVISMERIHLATLCLKRLPLTGRPRCDLFTLQSKIL